MLEYFVVRRWNYFPGNTFTLGAGDCYLYAVWDPCQEGEIGPGGGYVFYDKTFYSGSPSWRYLEAAPSDPWEYDAFSWYPDSPFATGCTSTAIGAGKANTDSIVSQQGTGLIYAARSAQEANINGLTGWFLPSKGELDLMYSRLRLFSLGGFGPTSYWTSSENSPSSAWMQRFGDGMQYADADNKDSQITIRPVRQF